MKCVLHKPTPPLDGLVDFLWALSDTPAHARERIVPAGTFELVINLDRDEILLYDEDACVRRHRGAVVSGTYRRSFVVDTRAHASMLGVHFKPGAARALVGERADALADTHVDLADLWSPAAVESLRDALCTAASTGERFTILEGALHSRLAPRAARPPVVEAVLARPGPLLRDIASDFGASQRSFIRAFSAEVGLTPKLFLRVRRFHRAFALAGANSSLGWAELALLCGYCDQSHLIRDFVAFADITPANYARLAATPAKADHIPLD